MVLVKLSLVNTDLVSAAVAEVSDFVVGIAAGSKPETDEREDVEQEADDPSVGIESSLRPRVAGLLAARALGVAAGGAEHNRHAEVSRRRRHHGHAQVVLRRGHSRVVLRRRHVWVVRLARIVVHSLANYNQTAASFIN